MKFLIAAAVLIGIVVTSISWYFNLPACWSDCFAPGEAWSPLPPFLWGIGSALVVLLAGRLLLSRGAG